MRQLVIIFTVILFHSASKAQPFVIPLWPQGKIPNYQKTTETEKRDTARIIKVSLVQSPDITVYLPARQSATGQAIVICPGGGYSWLSYNFEGSDPAAWLVSKGIAAIVLKYRLPNSKSNITPHLSPLMDAKRAMRIVRANASAWGVRTDAVGIMGFSAGGHLASTLATHFDGGDPEATDSIERQSSRPDFAVLVYPVITMSKSIMHAGSRNSLIGERADSALAKLYSNELQVSNRTPPCFLIHSMDDKTVPVENSLVFFEALKGSGVTGELHIFPKGGHGFGLGVGRGEAEQWTELCEQWLRNLNATHPSRLK